LGFAAGIWGVHIPSVKTHYGLTESGLSMALLAMAVGAVICLVFAGKLVAAFGARAIALFAGLVICGSLALVLQAETFVGLIPLMLVFGGANGLMDVSINAEGTVLEEQSGKRVMSNFHGMYSVGGMTGAGVGALLIAADVAATLQLAGLAAALAALVAAASTYMLPVHPQDPEQHAGFRVPSGTLLILGGLAAVGLLAEGAMYDWSVLYLQTDTAAAPALAALGYASFSAAMAATRFVGDKLREHWSPQRLMAASGVLAAVAMATVLIVRDPIVGLIGFALVGVGFANVVPILFIAATRVPNVAPATAIATVSSVGYLGFVAGPPLVGGIAHASSLTWALATVVVGALLLYVSARRIPV
jgi:predicted MFS family arabinose efflux permease